MKTKISILTLLALGMVFTFTACSKQGETAVAADSDAQSTGPSQFLLDSVPESPPGVIEAVQDANAGDAVVFTGRVGGVRDPLMKEFAAFVIADEIVVFCDEMGDDGHCSMPWDACCEDPAKVSAARAFVQFVDESGAPRPVNLEEAIGLAANQNVIVKGRLAPDSTPENRIILAEGITILQ
ncbi:MAG: hypothetical protein AB3N63_00395 [Puniceicoccaceae bacterium]